MCDACISFVRLLAAELTSKGFCDVGRGPGSRAGEYIEWLTIRDPAQAVSDDLYADENGEAVHEHCYVTRIKALTAEHLAIAVGD
jgi:hypothetical protein